MCTQSSIYAFWLLSDILCNRGLQKRATRSSRAVFKNSHFSRTTSHNQPVFENTKTFQVESPQLEALVFDHLPATTFRAKSLKFSFVFNLSETTTWLIMESKLYSKMFQLTLSHSWPQKTKMCQWEVLARVVQRLDDAIHRINHYPADSVVYFVNIYPLGSDLSGR